MKHLKFDFILENRALKGNELFLFLATLYLHYISLDLIEFRLGNLSRQN